MKPAVVALAGVLVVASAAAAAWQLHFGPLHAAEDAVRGHMTDPASAQFQRVALFKGGTVCGRVNAKNRLGGYAGYRAFFVFADGLVFLEPEESNPLLPLFRQQYASECAD